MRAFAILAMSVALATPALAADRIARNGADELRISDTACVHAGVLAQIPADKRERFRKATARVNGQLWYACWTEVDGHAFVLYEDGDKGVVPLTAFKPAQDT